MMSLKPSVTAVRMINFSFGVDQRVFRIIGRRTGKSSMHRALMMQMYQRIDDIQKGTTVRPYLTDVPERCVNEYKRQQFRKTIEEWLS